LHTINNKKSIRDETTSISSEIKTDVPHQFKDPYIKMLDQCGD
jgi:hypothetical protein